ncbi:MAG TPA: histidine phosphotransferase family protein, partial [Sphingorhabdus sp.]|nr:histidine phosphotransferase family protein [Sphingorhabdus sp.]
IKILLNLVLIANDALVRGGTLFVGAESRQGEHEIVIRANGPKIVMDDAIRSTLSGSLDASQVDSRTAAAWMARNLAVRGGGLVQLAEPDAEHLVIGALIRA